MAETKVVSYRLPVALADELAAEAARNEEPVSVLVIRLLRGGLEGDMAVRPDPPRPILPGGMRIDRVPASRVRGFSAISGEPIIATKGPAASPVKAGVAKAAKGKAVAE